MFSSVSGLNKAYNMTTVGILLEMPAGHRPKGSAACIKMMMAMPAPYSHQFVHVHPAPANCGCPLTARGQGHQQPAWLCPVRAGL